MDELFSGIKKSRADVFKDKASLTPYHLLSEDELVDRENERDNLVSYIKQALVGDNSKMLLIHGPSGAGKTAVTRFVLRRLQEEVDGALPMYIDCLGNNTEHSILTELIRFFRHFFEGKGRGSQEVALEFRELVKKDGRKPVLVLDNIDRVVDMEKTLWQIRSLPLCGLVLVSTGRGSISYRIGDRLRPSFTFEDLVFKAYDSDSLSDILKARVASAFICPVPDEALKAIAEYVVNKGGGNAKLAFSLLVDASEIAQSKEADQMKGKHVEEAIRKFERQGFYDKSEELRVKREEEFRLFQVITELEAKGVLLTTGELEKEMESKGLKMAARTLRYYLEDLEKRKLIAARMVKKGRGRTREIKLAVPLELALV